jgi:putative transcriptional regulator
MPAISLAAPPTAGERLREARTRARLTQLQLAERVGVTRVSIARIETGETAPRVALALAIADAVGESVEALFGGGR